MPKSRRVPLPKGKYLSEVEVKDTYLEIQWKKRKKVALLFVALNRQYWPYICQVIEDVKQHFLPHHNVDIFIWSDVGDYPLMREEIKRDFDAVQSTSPADQQKLVELVAGLALILKVFPEVDAIFKSLENSRIYFRSDGVKQWVEAATLQGEPDPSGRICKTLKEAGARMLAVMDKKVEFLKQNATIFETDGIQWPAPTLMRYHLFLNQEEKLKEYDYLFYLDADMRIVQRISDEILGKGLTAAPHPGYALSKKFIPPYEPNPESTAYIYRLGQVVEEEPGKKRFMPFYAAGGFQGGVKKHFFRAMRTMKSSIDKDFGKNYTAIWNDESHWNKYLWEFQRKGGAITFLDVSYVYPDSLIKEFYEQIWGRSYEPKIITLTKPFTLQKNSGLQELIQQTPKV